MNAFPRTLRSIAAAEARPRRGALVVPALLLTVWLGWFLGARVTVVEASATARLEVDRAPHPVDALTSGRVVTSHLALDREVKAGELLVELDTTLEGLRLDEAHQRIGSLSAQIERARGEAAADDAARREERRTVAVALDEARALKRGAEAQAGYSRLEAERLARLGAGKNLAELELRRAEAEREHRESAASSLALGVERLEHERRTRDEEARVRREKLLRDVAALEGELAVAHKAAERLEQEIERRRLRAPVAGRLGQIAALRPGASLREGERIALVVPSGQLRVVAQFPVAAAVGRVHAGQLARVRLDGFPFTAYGTVGARVSGVGSEAEAGLVRVELAVRPEARSPIPLQHGLTGVVEVEVERLAPAALVLRLAGRALSGSGARFPITGRAAGGAS